MLTVQEIVNGVALNGLFQYYDQSAEKNSCTVMKILALQP